MPLIILSGYPCSGKTHRAKQLAAYCSRRADEEASSPTPNDTAPPQPTRKRKRRTIHHISDHTLSIPRSAYASASTEKTARATLYSAAKRALAQPDDVTILDALNYIKGFRYQLSCEAKNARAGWGVVHVGVTPEQSREVNGARDGEGGGAGEEEPYSEEVLEELLMRFEEPNGMARWDSPLFTVVWDDTGEAWCERIWEEVVLGLSAASGDKDAVKRRVVRPNQAAILPPSTSSTHLHDLERTTSQIVSAIQAHQRANPGDPVVPIFTSSTSTQDEQSLVVRLPSTTNVSFAQLQRMKRQFVALHRVQMGGMGMGAIGAGAGASSESSARNGASGTQQSSPGGTSLLTASRAGELFIDYLNDWFGQQV